jgi:hypothetical protein
MKNSSAAHTGPRLLGAFRKATTGSMRFLQICSSLQSKKAAKPQSSETILDAVGLGNVYQKIYGDSNNDA